MRGAIEKRTGPQGVSYRVRVEYPPDPITGERKRPSKTVRTKKEAESLLARWLAEIERGTAVDPSKMTVAELLRSWLATIAHRVKPTTLEGYRHSIEYHIIPVLGAVRVQRLTATDVQRFYAAKLDSGHKPRTVQLCHLRLSQSLAQAERWGIVQRNVCNVVDPPRVEYQRPEPWTIEEARRFLVAARDDQNAPLWLLALTTGMRRGELLGVRWSDFDGAKQTIAVRQSVVVVGGKPTIQEPKTASARRAIKLPPETVAALVEHRKRQGELREAAGADWQNLGLIFTTRTGGVIDPNNVHRGFGSVMKRAGVPRIRLHDLRHTHATLLLGEGTPIKVVSERLGHSRTSTTLDVYSHSLPDMQDRAVEVIGGMLFPDAA